MGTYFNGGIRDVAVDAEGNIYVAGHVWSESNMTTTDDAFDRTVGGFLDGFWAKFTKNGGLVYSTFLGGSGEDFASSIAVDSTGNVYVTGETALGGGVPSSDFPTTANAFDKILSGGDDAFIAKFDPAGALVYSTFLGGGCDDCTTFPPGREWPTSIAVDDLGDVYITGGTNTPMGNANRDGADGTIFQEFPTTVGILKPENSRSDPYDDWDVFVTELNPEGADLVYSIVVGGSYLDFGDSIAVDPSGNIHVAGSADSADFPVTPGSFDTSLGADGHDGLVMELDPGRQGVQSLAYSTFLGGDAYDEVYSVATDSAGHAYLAGVTLSPDFPTAAVTFDSILDGPSDAFLAVLDPSGTALTYSTFMGGASSDIATAVLVDESRQAYTVGYTASDDFPTTPGSFDRTFNGIVDAFVAKLDLDSGVLVYSTFLGGGDQVVYSGDDACLVRENDAPSYDVAQALDLDPSGNMTVVGGTNSTDFPTTEGAFNTTGPGSFIVRLELVPEPNRAPVACFEVVPPAEGEFTVFVNASTSADAEDPDDLLEVRWDWESDGIWDTLWSTVKTAWHEYEAAGTHAIRLEVRDTGGLAATTTRLAYVCCLASGEIAWIRQIGTAANESADQIAVDAERNIYVAGHGVRFVEMGCVLWSYESVRADAPFLRKYDAAGNVLWTRADYGAGLAADSTGVYLTGSSYVWKYDTEGNRVWTRQFGDTNRYVTHKIAVDGTGVYVAGTTNTSLGAGSMGYDAFVAKLDLEGNLVWISRFGTSADDQVDAIALNPLGLHVAGTSGDSGSGFLAKVDPDGRKVWTRFVETSLDFEWATSVDHSGVYLAGYTRGYLGNEMLIQRYDESGNLVRTHQFQTALDRPLGAAFVDGSGVYMVGWSDSVACDDAFVQRSDFDGNEIWTRQFGTTRMERAGAVAVGESAVYVAGWTSGFFPGQGSAGGLDGFVAKIAAPNAPPTLAEIMSTSTTVVTGQEITLTASASDPDMDPLTHAWDFGDGTSALGTTAAGGGTVSATHAYAEAGTYVVTLTVDDGRGGVATQASSVRVVAPLSSEISADPIAGKIPLTVSFAASPTGGVPPYSFAWDFGDGGSSTTQNPTHTYQVAGTHIVTLNITDADSRTVTKTLQIAVERPPVPPDGPPPWIPYVAAAGVAISVGSALLWRSRHRLHPPPPPDGTG